MSVFKEEKIMIDIIEQIGEGSIIHHGKLSNRVYLIKLAVADITTIIDAIESLAERNSYSKIICKIANKFAPQFLASGYTIEAYIPQFYNMKDDAIFVSRFLSDDRVLKINISDFKRFEQLLNAPLEAKQLVGCQSEYSVRRLEKSDISQMVNIYLEVFETYPFPIHDPAYISQTMDDNIHYFGAFKEGRLAAMASSEIDFKGQNAEMTDFATHREHTGRNLSCVLLKAMEQHLLQLGIETLFTIARTNSIPMNKTFLRLNYIYSGTLINNTHIGGSVESMNVYYKRITNI